MAKNNIQRVCSLGTGTLKFTSTTSTFEYGAFSSVTHGYGIALSSSRTAAFKVYADDANAVMSGSLRNILARTLVTIDQTGGVSLRSVMGHIKLASGIDFSSADSVVAPIEGYIEQAGSSSYSGRTSLVRAYIDSGSSNITVASGGILAGCLAEIRCTGTLTATGKMAGFMTRSQSNEASYKKWAYGIYFPANSVTEAIRIGDSADTSGSGITLSSAITAANRFHADDGGAVLSGSLRNVLARTLVSIDQTGGVSVRSLMGQLKMASGIDFSSADSRAFAVEGYVEQGGNSSYTGQAGAVRAYIDAGSGNITSASGAIVGGVIAELRCTGTLTSTGVVGAFVAKATSNEASYKRWTYGVYLDGASVARVLSAGSSSSDAVTDDTASAVFYRQYTDCGATSGTSQGMYVRHYITGEGGSGQALRAFGSVQNVAAVDARGAHISLNFGATGTVSGSGQALTTTLHIADQATQSGTLSAITTEIYSDGDTSDPAGATLSCIRMSQAGGTGKADVDTDCNAFHFDSGWTVGDGKMIAKDGSPAAMGNCVYTIRVMMPDGLGYIPVLAAPVTA